MRLDSFTSKFQLAISDAQSIALGRDHQFIEPVHLMTALLNQQGGSVRALFDHAKVNVNTLRSALAEAVDHLPRVEGVGGDGEADDLGARVAIEQEARREAADVA